jgi:hypothetical protein
MALAVMTKTNLGFVGVLIVNQENGPTRIRTGNQGIMSSLL